MRLVWVVAIGILILASPAPAGAGSRSNDLARKFPEFGKQKPQLTKIAIVVDLAEFEVDDGEASWIYLDDCRGLAQKLEDSFVAAFGAKGYPVKPLPVLSVGQGADTTKRCRVFTSWAKRDLRPKELSPISSPFYVDSMLNATPELVAAWRGVVQATAHWKSPKRGEAAVIPETMMVREVLDADYALVAVGLGTRNVRYYGVPTGGNFGAMASVPDPSPYPGSRVQIALVDCRNGTVLWADARSDMRAFKESRMDDLAEDFVAQMP